MRLPPPLPTLPQPHLNRPLILSSHCLRIQYTVNPTLSTLHTHTCATGSQPLIPVLNKHNCTIICCVICCLLSKERQLIFSQWERMLNCLTCYCNSRPLQTPIVKRKTGQSTVTRTASNCEQWVSWWSCAITGKNSNLTEVDPWESHGHCFQWWNKSSIWTVAVRWQFVFFVFFATFWSQSWLSSSDNAEMSSTIYCCLLDRV